MEKEKIKSYKDLIVWQKARKFVVLVYRATDKFPRHELFGIVSQMRRAAISIPSNLADGFRRKTTKDKLQFIRVAYGSGSELETQLIIAGDLGYISDENLKQLLELLSEIMRMLNKIIMTFEARKLL